MSMSGNILDQISRLKEQPSAKSVPQDKLPVSPKLFVYCSAPQPIPKSKVSGRPLYRNNVPKPEGWHSYYNISWDPRVRRGDPLKAQKKREQEEIEKIRRKLAQPRKKDAKAISKDEKKQNRTSDPQVMIRAANMRYARLAISNLLPQKKDAFFVELQDELDQDEICNQGKRIGAAKVLPKCPSCKKNLVDAASQIWPGEFFDFDREVVPILERLIGSVCYQARLEVLEEAEFEALQMERQQFEEQKKMEEEEMGKLKDRMDSQISEQKRQLELVRKQTNDVINGDAVFSMFAGVYTKYSTSDAMRALGEDWQTGERIRQAIESDFNAWLNSEVTSQINLHLESMNFLDDLIRHVVTDREAEYASHMWKDVYAEEPVRVFTDEMEPSRVPPPTPGSSIYYTSDEEGHQSSTSHYAADTE